MLYGDAPVNIRWRRWRLLSVLMTVALLLATIGLDRRHTRLQAVAENTAKAETLKVVLDRRFPAGTLESDLVPILREEYPNHVMSPATGSTEYGLPVGDEPSDVWYCGSWTRGVRLRFEAGRLASIRVERWSVDCL